MEFKSFEIELENLENLILAIKHPNIGRDYSDSTAFESINALVWHFDSNFCSSGFDFEEINGFFRYVTIVLSCCDQNSHECSDLLLSIQSAAIPQIQKLIPKVAELIVSSCSAEEVLSFTDSLLLFARLSTNLPSPVQFLICIWKALSKITSEMGDMLRSLPDFSLHNLWSPLVALVEDGLRQLHNLLLKKESDSKHTHWTMACKLTLFFLGRMVGLCSPFTSMFTEDMKTKFEEFIFLFRAFVDCHLLKAIGEDSIDLDEFEKLDLANKADEGYIKFLKTVSTQECTWFQLLIHHIQNTQPIAKLSFEDSASLTSYGRQMLTMGTLRHFEPEILNAELQHQQACLQSLIVASCGAYPILQYVQVSAGLVIFDQFAHSTSLLVKGIARNQFSEAQVLLCKYTLHQHPFIRAIWPWVWSEFLFGLPFEVQCFFIEMLLELACNQLTMTDTAEFVNIIVLLTVDQPEDFQGAVLDSLDSRISKLGCGAHPSDANVKLLRKLLCTLQLEDFESVNAQELFSSLQLKYGQALGTCNFNEHSIESLQVSEMVVALLHAREPTSKHLGEDLLRQGIQEKLKDVYQLKTRPERADVSSILSILSCLEEPKFEDPLELETVLNLCNFLLHSQCKSERQKGASEIQVIECLIHLVLKTPRTTLNQPGISKKFLNLIVTLLSSDSWIVKLESIGLATFCLQDTFDERFQEILQSCLESQENDLVGFLEHGQQMAARIGAHREERKCLQFNSNTLCLLDVVCSEITILYKASSKCQLTLPNSCNKFDSLYNEQKQSCLSIKKAQDKANPCVESTVGTLCQDEQVMVVRLPGNSKSSFVLVPTQCGDWDQNQTSISCNYKELTDFFETNPAIRQLLRPQKGIIRQILSNDKRTGDTHSFNFSKVDVVCDLNNEIMVFP